MALRRVHVKSVKRARHSAVARRRAKKRAGRITSAGRTARALIKQATREISFAHPAIVTELAVKRGHLLVTISTPDRDTGKKVRLEFRWELPLFLFGPEHAVDWIYETVRHAWVHELNEALFVNGVRRRDLHDNQNRTLSPPDEAQRTAVDEFREQLAAFLMGANRR
jgi:hypothetical protein